VTTARWLAAGCVAAGIFLAGTAPEPPARFPDAAAGFTVLSADFHVHGFPDGIAPWDAAREARRRRLDVIALTSHNTRFGWWLWRLAPRWLAPSDVLVLPGEELTSVGYHLALVGVSRAIDWNQPIREAAEAARAAGGVAILAHPGGGTVKRLLTDEALRSLDGVEAAHPAMDATVTMRQEFLDVFNRARAVKPAIAAIGSSDFHVFAPLGVCRTYVFVRDRTMSGVVDAVREGRTVACDVRGDTYGPQELRAIVAERCRSDATSPPAGDSRAARIGTWLTLAGLLALVLGGPSES